MADYWKSTGKWYCDICKCWTGDNKASIEFHERGKRHSENKRKKIIEIKRDAMGKRKQDKEEGKMFAQIEKDALAAVQKDVAGGVAGRSDLKNIISAHSAEANVVGKIDTHPWSAMTAPQGFTYYYNSITGESTWIVPEVFKEIEEQKKKKEDEVDSKSCEKMEKKKKEKRKEAAVDQEEDLVMERDVHPLLGGWSKVDVDQHTVEKETKTDTSGDSVVQVTAEEEVDETQVPRESGKKFKEKVMSTNLTSYDEPVTFKKRKGSQKIMRKRNDEDE